MDKIIFYGSINTHNIINNFDIANAETVLSKYHAGGFHVDEFLSHVDSDPNLLHFRLVFTGVDAVDNLIDVLEQLDDSILALDNYYGFASDSISKAIAYLQKYQTDGPDYLYTESNGHTWDVNADHDIFSIYELPAIPVISSDDWNMTISIYPHFEEDIIQETSASKSDPAPISDYIRRSDVVEYLTEFRDILLSKSYSNAVTESLSTSVAKTVSSFINTVAKMPSTDRPDSEWCRSYIKPIEKKQILLALGDPDFTEHTSFQYVVGIYTDKTWWVYDPFTAVYKGLSEPPVYWKYVDIYRSDAK